MKSAICPLCGKDDAVRCRDEARFYHQGKLTAICFHGHDGRGPALFVPESGELLRQVELQPQELLYRAAEADGARGFGAAFLAEHCGIYALSRKAIQQVQPTVPTERDWVRAQEQEGVLTVAPLYRGAALAGLEVRIVETKSIGSVSKWTRVLGERAVYIANTRMQPEAVVLFEGTWDAVAASWDALEAGEPLRYAFAAVAASTSVDVIQETLEVQFPGVPVVIVTDQDGAGKGARAKFARLGTLAILPGTGLAKDYREADPAKRRKALLESIERALDAPAPGREFGNALIARRALEGVIRGKVRGLRDIEAWRYGQRCAGICRCFSGSKRYFSIRARIDNQMPVAEGQFDFSSILAHPSIRRVRTDYPNLAAIIEGGATESHVSTSWLPPQFLEDGRHWTELRPEDRKVYARERGWEPWSQKDPGAPEPGDLATFLDEVHKAYRFVRIPGTPDSEVGDRVAIFASATALSALWAEERWQAREPLGFLPCSWFYGGPATGKGTAAKLVSLMVAGDLRTRGSQRFDGATGGWLTESVLHLPVCFRDELDEFLNHTEIEDLKTYLAGEPLQLRKKFGSDMTIAPKPVVFSSNKLKINEDDEATKDRIVIIQLEPNPISTKPQRNSVFDAFYHWIEDGGRSLVHRVGIALYRDFRMRPVGPAQWTRSGAFDSAVAFVCERIGVSAQGVMAAAQAGKESAIRSNLPWFQAIQDYVTHELADVHGYHEAKMVGVWGINPSDEAQARKLRRWTEQIERATEAGPMTVHGWAVSAGARSPSTSRLLTFRSITEQGGVTSVVTLSGDQEEVSNEN